jgi:hypothetical protein
MSEGRKLEVRPGDTVFVSVGEDGDSQWAVDVRNFLDKLTDPEGYGHAVSEEVVKEAARLRDA